MDRVYLAESCERKKSTFEFLLILLNVILERRFYQSGESGIIASPNYPRNYGLNKSFYWTIYAPEDRIVEIDIQDLQIEGDKDCVKDFLRFYDGSTTAAPLLRTYCGESRPYSFRSTGSIVYLHFRSDSDSTQKGFKLAWRTYVKVKGTEPPTDQPESINLPEGIVRLLE